MARWVTGTALGAVAAMLAALAVGANAPQDAATVRFQKVAERLVAAVNAPDYAAVSQDFGQVMLEAFPREKSEPFFKGLTAANGKVAGLDPPRLVPPAQAIFPVRFERAVLDMKIVLDDRDKIIGLWFLPHTPDVPVPERHATRLALPFQGRWLVVWGGDTKELNQHHDNPGQRYAFDMLGVGGDGKTHQGDGRANEDYYCFGRPILAGRSSTMMLVWSLSFGN